MPVKRKAERPLGVYLVALYFVLAGFLEPIRKYREWEGPLVLNPLGEHSLWELLVDTIIYLTIACLIWHFAWLGRLAALVYGYLVLGTWVGLGIYLLYQGDVTVTPLFLTIGIFHVVCLIPVLWYLQPQRRKKLFRVSLLEILLSSD